MGKHSTQTLQLTRRAAALTVRQMIDEFHMLMSSFPNLRDAFDPDGLPVEFILKRDSQSEPVARPMRSVRSGVSPMSRRMRAHDVEHRGRQRKPASDE